MLMAPELSVHYSPTDYHRTLRRQKPSTSCMYATWMLRTPVRGRWGGVCPWHTYCHAPQVYYEPLSSGFRLSETCDVAFAVALLSRDDLKSNCTKKVTVCVCSPSYKVNRRHSPPRPGVFVVLWSLLRQQQSPQHHPLQVMIFL